MKRQYLKPAVVEHKLIMESMILGQSKKQDTSAGWGNTTPGTGETEQPTSPDKDEDGIPGIEGPGIGNI